ncbi:TPA: response regulator [Legionella feeleii]|uniref:Aerobic respiration control sensor protein ArcB n=1 Tax=Legionella feeleii TaxID=453 RepID=A0A0W0THW0_9GAMM|nr:response regulator [Legionella feeleii]KTC95176.1 sensory histidine-kinase / response regulator [Legionella feeleii]SPX62466.1 Aerobic respiration control sensor protein ArcB [Legionella feeleii]STX39553.1 Aerobic respiration control sensor protein ArcB [Legionella feeleii]
MNKPYRILVVEDSQPAQVVAKQHLTDLDCVVDIAADGDSAIEKCNTVPYDVVLMDLGLYPGENGFEVAKLIKTKSIHNKNTPIIVLSIHSEAQFYEQAKDAYISGFISKPFTRFEATEVVNFIGGDSFKSAI